MSFYFAKRISKQSKNNHKNSIFINPLNRISLHETTGMYAENDAYINHQSIILFLFIQGKYQVTGSAMYRQELIY
jgi:hypothetical protein